jgi:hypothetical protein
LSAKFFAYKLPVVPITSTSWKPGVSLNPNGRPKGSRNIRTQEVIDKIKSLGHKDPLVTLSELQHGDPDPSIRATAANMLAPYLHSKMGTTPVPPPPRYMEIQQQIQQPTSIAQAYDNILYLSDLKAKGEIDIESADSLINDQRVVLNAMVDEAKLLAAQGDPNAEHKIIIEGGLPTLPGTNVTMPHQLNGHANDGLLPKQPVIVDHGPHPVATPAEPNSGNAK